MAEREEALREAQLLSALRHPNIIALIGSCWNVEEGFVRWPQ